MNQARDRILQRLRQRTVQSTVMPTDPAVLLRDWDEAECVRRFADQLNSNHAEVIAIQDEELASVLTKTLKAHKATNLLLGGHHSFERLLPALERQNIRLIRYKDSVEQWQDELFNNCDAALTTTMGGIAETGSLMLWPNADEPRMMSLVPPLHIAVVAQSKLRATFAQAIAEPPWNGQLPTNALLISGPSKTADIEQTLVYGAHGPSELVVIIIQDQ